MNLLITFEVEDERNYFLLKKYLIRNKAYTVCRNQLVSNKLFKKETCKLCQNLKKCFDRLFTGFISTQSTKTFD